MSTQDTQQGAHRDLAQLPIRIVLVETSHPGNIGAVARAMKTMTLRELHLVHPKVFPHADATAMASGADDLLAQAVVWDSLEEAIAECGLCLGASARLRSLPWPLVEPGEAAEQVMVESKRHPTALVFGRERTGLTNEELALCHGLVNIPSNPAYSSLNLAMAVQIMCYELLMLNRRLVPKVDAKHDDSQKAIEAEVQIATSEQMNYFYQHLQQVMIDLEFLDPAAPKHLMRRMRRLFGRARPETTELNILRGVLTAVDKHVRKAD